MLTQQQMEDHGNRIREALEVIGLRFPTNPQPQDFLYLYAVVSNFLRLLEVDYGVMPGVFGSHGFAVAVLNPASGDLETVQRPGFHSLGEAALKPAPPDGTFPAGL